MSWRITGPAPDVVEAVRAALRENSAPDDPLAQAAFDWLCEVDGDDHWPTPLRSTMTRHEASRLTSRASAMRRVIGAGDVDPAFGLSLVVWPTAAILEAEAALVA